MAKSLKELRKLQRNQLKGVNKDEIIDAILAAEDDAAVSARQDSKLDQIVKELEELRTIISSQENSAKVQIKELTDVIKKQSEVILQHQLFLEQLDRKNRENNLVLFGIPDEQSAFDGGTSEEDKIQKVLGIVEADSDAVVRSHRMLGRPDQVNNNRPRPVLIRVDSKFIRDKVLEKAKKLKDLNDPFKKVYIKKDSHPEVRKEWKRLRDAEEAETRNNVGCDIRLDFKQRVLYKDGCIIDKWRPHPF